MNSNIESLTMKKLKDFARDNTVNQITVKGKYKDIYSLAKIKYNQYITFIYESENLSNDNDYNLLNIKFKKIGFYNSQDDNLYNLSFHVYWDFNISEKEVEDMPTTENVCDSVMKAIEDKARSMVDDSLKVEKLSEENSKELEEYKKYDLKESVRNKFFTEIQKVTINDWFIRLDKNFLIIDYITLGTKEEKEKFILQKAKENIQNNRNKIVLLLKKIDLLNKELKAIYKDKNHIYHIRKAIAQAVKGKKTVNVTILKNEQTFTFKTETRTLSNGQYEEYYSDFDIQAKDRQKYKELFGYEHYTADEILKITYGKKEIYTKEKQ